MPRDNDKNNGPSRGRPPGEFAGKFAGKSGGGKSRSGAARGPEKKFAKRGITGTLSGKTDGAFGGGEKTYAKKPYAGPGKPYAGKREGPPPRRDDDRAPRRDRSDAPRRERSDAPRTARFNKDDRPARSGSGERGPRKEFSPRSGGGEKRPYTPRSERGGERSDTRSDTRPAARFADKTFGDRKPYQSRDGGGEKRPYTPRGDSDRPRSSGPKRDGDQPFGGGPKKFGDKKFGDKKFARGAPDRGPRKDFGSRPDRARGEDRGESKPWQKRDASAPEHAGRNSRPPRDFDKPKFDRPREARADRPTFSRPRQERGDRDDRPARSAWQEHPRSEGRTEDRPRREQENERPRRENEDETKIFAKRPAFGGRGAYRERDPEERRPPRPPAPTKAGERVAKVISRAGLCSRRDAEEWVTSGRVAVNGRVINSPALDVTTRDVITVDGKPLPAPERTRLFMYHKPRGLMTTHADPEGRPTVFDHLPEGLPRLISIGRLDFNTEGLLLLTNDGGLARTLELPDTGWLRRYRVRAHGDVTQGQLDALKDGVEVDGVKYGSIDAKLERDQGANVWLVFAIREGKNREVRNVLAHLGLEVNRLIRISYGPFQLAELEEGQVDEVKTRVLREQLGEKIATAAGANFARQLPSKGDVPDEPIVKKPVLKRSTVEDRKGRRVLVQRAGSDESRARNEEDASGFGPPKRPKRGYHGKRDITPRDE